MSSSSSDSDDYEPMRKIKINIRPKEEVAQTGAADVNLIKASVESWRPLGPPTHPSLARRQSSLSSVSSMSFGTGSIYGGSGNNNMMAHSNMAMPPGGHSMHSSPSCSSLVNEFNTRSSFSNLMPAASRTSSPSMSHGDTVPIAIAIQESIELVVKGHYNPNAIEPKYQTRSLGNIKVAFPNAFARCNYGETGAPLKLRMHSTDNIIRYYASRLINDLDLKTNDKSPPNNGKSTTHTNGTEGAEHFSFGDAFGAETLQDNSNFSNSKLIEFNMEALTNQLRDMYDKCPTSRYYNVDILRYQICPISSVSESPLQVCAYWKIESQMVKLRIDFKHSVESGFNLDRLREIIFTVKLTDFIPDGVVVNSLQNGSSPPLNSTSRNNNQNGETRNNNFINNIRNMHTEVNYNPQIGGIIEKKTESTLVWIPPPPIPYKSTTVPVNHRANNRPLTFNTRPNPIDISCQPSLVTATQQESPRYLDDLLLLGSNGSTSSVEPSGVWSVDKKEKKKPETDSASSAKGNAPSLSYKPPARWDSNTKQLTWKFDTLLAYHKSDGMGSLLAKLDMRECKDLPAAFVNDCPSSPAPVDVKFLVSDSTLSKASLSVDSAGYKMSLLKREIRSGRYISEPYIL